MNGRDRILAALRGEKPDRVPYFDIYIDPKVIDGIYPGMSYETFVETEDVDAAYCFAIVEDMDAVEWVDVERRIFLDKWGAHQQMLGDELLALVQPPARIETDEDLANYVAPDPAKSPALQGAKRMLDRFGGERAVIAVGEATFAPQQYLRGGLEPLMFDYVDRPEFVEKLARIGVAYYSELYRLLLDMGVDAILLGDDYAGKSGPMMSPKHFEQFILPGLTEVIHAIKQAGGYVIKHSDGNIWPIMDMLLSTELDMLGPLEPAHMDLKQVHDYSAGRVGVMGNVDVDLLSRGSVDDVEAATRDLLERVSPDGGHILASGNTVASYVDPRNYKAMLDTLKAHGCYPVTA